MKSYDIGCRIYLITAGLFVVMGIYMALCKDTILFAPFASLIHPVFWKDALPDTGTIAFRSFMYSLAGAMMTVWGIQMGAIAQFALRKKEKWAWIALAVSCAVWFLIDESFSAYYGVWMNVIGNLSVLILQVVPLYLTRESLKG